MKQCGNLSKVIKWIDIMYMCDTGNWNFHHQCLHKATTKKSQKPWVTKEFSGFNHDGDVPYKKRIQKIKLFWRYFM